MNLKFLNLIWLQRIISISIIIASYPLYLAKELELSAGLAAGAFIMISLSRKRHRDRPRNSLYLRSVSSVLFALLGFGYFGINLVIFSWAFLAVSALFALFAFLEYKS